MPERINVFKPEADDIRQGADIVIIGAGMTGPPLAYFAKNKLGSKTRIRVIEAKPQVGQGSSVYSLEQGRCGWHDQVVCEMMNISRNVFLHPKDFGLQVTSDQLGYKERPYLWLASTPEEVITYQRLAEVLRKRGVDAEYLDFELVLKICPWLTNTSVVGGIMDNTAYKVDSQQVAKSFAASAQNTDFFIDTAALAIIVEGGKVIGVKTTCGFIHTDMVIVAAGSVTRKLVETVDGLSAPIISFPRYYYASQSRNNQLGNNDPFIIVPRTYAYWRTEPGGIIGGFSHGVHPVESPDDTHSAVDNSFKRTFLTAVWQGLNKEHQYDPEKVESDPLGFLATAEFSGRPFGPGKVDGGYYVHRKETPNDDRPLITWVAPGIGVVTAEQGHGVMGGPASGLIGAEIFFGEQGGQETIKHNNFSINPPSSQDKTLTI
jgi:glycine/D-amino acid oxidase-like deaminating enzyme